MLLLGLTQAALPFTGGLVSLTVVALLMGFGNGIGSGVLMALAADVAPRKVRAQFLGAWRLCSDSGTAAGPLVVSAAAGPGSGARRTGSHWLSREQVVTSANAESKGGGDG